MDERLRQLEKEYCPPIDSALFYAIILEYDLDDQNSLDEARNVLDGLKPSAEAEATTGFDPSGSSTAQNANELEQESQSQPQSLRGGQVALSNSTDLTSPLQSLDLGSSESGSRTPSSHGYDHAIEELPADEKIGILQQSFPNLKVFDIKHTLSRCDNNVERAIDDLLTQSLFQEGYDVDGQQSVLPKGIEGFAQNAAYKRKRKGKGKKLKLDLQYLPDSSSSTPTVLTPQSAMAVNKWTASKGDIEFIVQRTGLSTSTVTSAFHRSSGCFRTTLADLSERNIEKSGVALEDEDAMVQVNIADLTSEFPAIPARVCRGIIKLTHPLTATAHELAKAYLSRPMGSQVDSVGGLVTPQYSRPTLENLEDGDEQSYTTIGRTPRPAQISGGYGKAVASASNYRQARAAAFAKATAAYRKSRSNPLMGGAAAYYAQLGHDASASVQAYTSAAADAIAAEQSSSTYVDLHRLDVANGVRIALDKVHIWWESGPREWAGERKLSSEDGFRIVTGAGIHSVGGRAKLGPAVRKALVQDGWRIDEMSGVLNVVGRVRR